GGGRMARTKRIHARVGVQRAQQAAQPRPTPGEVVRGINLTVSGRELAVRLTERIRWHRERGDALLVQMKKLLEVEREAGEDLANALAGDNSPRATVDKKLREHQERASFLTFIRDHIAAESLYRLDSTDLRMTEILPDRPW